MRVLLTGANGFIGQQLLVALQSAGHEVLACARRPDALARRYPGLDVLTVDFNRDVKPADWHPRLKDVDAVINCAGILQGRPGQSMEAVHTQAPLALFQACEDLGVARVVQISAISAGESAGTAYAASKAAADEGLAAMDLDWVILRPSLIYGDGSFGGTSLIRALAAFPYVIPLPGKGDQAFNPLQVTDLARTVLLALESDQLVRKRLEPMGPECLSLKQLVLAYRAWLGLGPAAFFHLPIGLMSLFARLGDLFGRGPFNTTALRQIVAGNAGDYDSFRKEIDFEPRTLAQALASRPAESQDLWHARLYLLRPLLRLSLAFLWIYSGLVGLLRPEEGLKVIAAAFGVTGASAQALLWGSCLLDLTLGAAVIFLWRVNLSAILQLAVIAGYTLVLGLALPELWADLFGPLAKNIPILALVLVWRVLEQER